MSIGVICGFQAEIDCFNKAIHAANLNPQHFTIIPSGSSSERAREAAERLVNEGCDKLISFGIAGGLDPALGVGDVVFSNHVVTTMDESYGTKPKGKIEKPTLRAGSRTVKGSICGVDSIAFTPQDKTKLFAATKAACADMESHAVARTAIKNNLAFFAIRAISDASRDTLPAFVANGVDASGQPQIMPILKGLAANPFSLPLLLTLKKNTDTALNALETASVRLLPSLI
ncbi:MAG: hypothetical protein ABJL18_09440 [Hyphomicrobiales bacterium]